MPSVRRVSATFALAALVSPFAGGAALTMHVGAHRQSHHAHHDGDHGVDVDDHHDVSVDDVGEHHDDSEYHRDEHDHASDFRQVWHGHRHDQTTPEHTHPSAFASAATTLGPAAPRVIPSHGSHAFERADDSCGSFDAVAVALACPAPSPPAEPPTILRI
jgi:hypothetical protein